MRKIGKTIAFVAAGTMAIMLPSCGDSTMTAPADNYPTLVVSTSDETMTTSSSATIRGRQDIEIYPQISGKITRVCVTEGEVVRKGQTLFVIDRVPYEAALRVAEANLAAAEVGIESAQLDYDSTKELYDNKVVSAYELQTALNALHTAQATRAQMEAGLLRDGIRVRSGKTEGNVEAAPAK